MIRKDFNWIQFTFSWFFNWCSIDFNLLLQLISICVQIDFQLISIEFHLISIGFNWIFNSIHLNLCSLDFQLIYIMYFQLMFIWFQLITCWTGIRFHWNSKPLKWNRIKTTLHYVAFTCMFAHRCWCEDAGRIPAEDIRLDFQEVVPAPSPLPLATQRSRPEPVPHCLRWGTRDSVLRGSQRLGAALVAAEQKPEAPLEGFSFHTNTLSDLWGTLGDKECHVIWDGKAFVGKALGAFLGLLGNHMALSHKSSHQNMFDLFPKKGSKIIRVSSACPWSWTCAQFCSAMHACVIPQLLGELKPIGSLSASQLSCNSAGWLSPKWPWWTMRGPHVLNLLRPSNFLSVEDLFGPGQILRRSCFTQGNPVFSVLSAIPRWNPTGSHFRMGASSARTWVWTCVHAFALCVS